MEKKCSQYNLETISAFVDKELGPKQLDKFACHVETCEACRLVVDQLQGIKEAFKSAAEDEMKSIDSQVFLSSVTAKSFNRKPAIFEKLKEYLSPKPILKIATIAVILGFSLMYFRQPGINGIGPSAIVNSVDTNMSSVMIIETIETKHTIIWFTET
ncbi:MAG: zf-HC2 domain-containing protein [Desulfobacteraceae bacterium]|nr:zf-HC2 domain-containing protein [Desulfobacteraceae bacterium]